MYTTLLKPTHGHCSMATARSTPGEITTAGHTRPRHHNRHESRRPLHRHCSLGSITRVGCRHRCTRSTTPGVWPTGTCVVPTMASLDRAAASASRTACSDAMSGCPSAVSLFPLTNRCDWDGDDRDDDDGDDDRDREPLPTHLCFSPLPHNRSSSSRGCASSGACRSTTRRRSRPSTR